MPELGAQFAGHIEQPDHGGVIALNCRRKGNFPARAGCTRRAAGDRRPGSVPFLRMIRIYPLIKSGYCSGRRRADMERRLTGGRTAARGAAAGHAYFGACTMRRRMGFARGFHAKPACTLIGGFSGWREKSRFLFSVPAGRRLGIARAAGAPAPWRFVSPAPEIAGRWRTPAGLCAAGGADENTRSFNAQVCIRRAPVCLAYIPVLAAACPAADLRSARTAWRPGGPGRHLPGIPGANVAAHC